MTFSVVTQIAPEDNINVFENMIKSVSFADNITVYVMDMKGDKKLSQYTKKYNLKIIHISTPTVVEAIRAEQVNNAKGDWVLIMDFDEIITTDLRAEIIYIIKSSTHFPAAPLHSSIERRGAYQIPRRNFSLGYQLKRGGWGTDYVIRLFKKSQFIDWPTDIHSTPTFTGDLGKLAHSMDHHKDPSLEYIVNKTNRYTDKEATQYYDGGMELVTSFTLLRKLKMEMIRRGIFKRGLLDGKIGPIQSIYQGFSVFMSYAKLYEKQLPTKHRTLT